MLLFAGVSASGALLSSPDGVRLLPIDRTQKSAFLKKCALSPNLNIAGAGQERRV
ncbi:hypothetical protein [Amaricoccus macauensis]|uniref:hypothetical protein n=1 Tax=Amaricoccus macauensis TaxID=57001 RepID=UPI003C7A2EAF